MMTQANVTTDMKLLERVIFACLITSMQLFLVAGYLKIAFKHLAGLWMGGHGEGCE